MNKINLLYIDLFCGAGGTSSGVEYATVDGRKCAEVIACVNHDANAIKSHAANHPKTMHFTEDIRTLAEHLFRYIEAIDPDYIQIENVEEFMCWGDLDENGHPISRFEGRNYMRWVKHVTDYGYDYDWRLLNAADFGAYTSRKRFFGQFAKKGLPIAFPVQTHAKMPSDLYPNKNNPKNFYPTPDWHELFPGFYLPWKPVREVLDLEDEGESIFAKKKPLCEKTLERIYAGLIKFVAGGKERHEAWILKYNSAHQNGQHNAPGFDEPCPTVCVQNRLGLVKAQFLSKQFSGDPMSKNQGIDRPAGTVTCKDHHAFVTAYYGNGFNQSVDEPSPTVTTKDRIALVTSQYLMNPQFASAGGSIDMPCFTLIARMDKMPPYLVSTEQGVGIAIFDDDTPMTRKVKEFMAMYGIVDIKMRMLKIVELKRIMGFPEDYTLIGTQAEQKKFIGNAVEVNMSRVLCEALARKLMDKAA